MKQTTTKIIGTRLATTSLIGAGVGIGRVFGTRYFSKSSITAYPPSRYPSVPIPPFTQGTDETDTFLSGLLISNITNLDNWGRLVEHDGETIRTLMHDTQSRTQEINQQLRDMEEDVSDRDDILEYSRLLASLREGTEPPINNRIAWLNLRHDLNNPRVPGLSNLRNYVEQTIAREISLPELYDTLQPLIPRIDSPGEDSDSQLFSDSSSNQENLSAEGNVGESESSSHSEDSSDGDESVSSSDSNDDNPPGYGQGLNHSNNQSEGNNQSDDNLGSSQSNNGSESNPNVSEPVSESNPNVTESVNESNSNINESANEPSPGKKLITDDAPDYGPCMRFLFGDPALEEDKSTINFVIQKQQEEMPDIPDSDGGE